MKLLNLLLLCGLLQAAVVSAAEIKMKSLGYEPKRLEITQGETVHWRNTALTEHSAVGDDGTFDTGMTAPGKESKEVRFEKAGEFKYHCGLHGKTMSGVIVVKAPAK